MTQENPMDPAQIEYVDGYSQQVVRRVPRDEVPEALRDVFLRQGQAVTRREDADEIIPIVRVVSDGLDAQHRLVPPEQAEEMIVREYDALGRCQRTTVMRRSSR